MKKDKKKCFYCGTLYSTEEKARDCENKHDIIFVPFIREDLNRLVNFIATGEKELLTKRLLRTLYRYFRSDLAKD
jgi:hypothetical protein